MSTSGGTAGLEFSPVQSYVATNQNTGSTVYTSLASAGPQLTLTVPPSGRVKVTIGCSLFNDFSGAYAAMSYSLSGANAVAASDATSVIAGNSGNVQVTGSRSFLHTGLTPGATTFTCLYRSPTGSGQANFADRRLLLEPA